MSKKGIVKKLSKIYPYDENTISSLLYMEENISIDPTDSLIQEIVQIYAVI
jgi:hypothetical protein